MTKHTTAVLAVTAALAAAAAPLAPAGLSHTDELSAIARPYAEAAFGVVAKITFNPFSIT